MKTKKDRAASRERRRSDRAVLLRLVQEAKPIYKWLALACLISLGIIACAVAAPQLLGDCVFHKHTLVYLEFAEEDVFVHLVGSGSAVG